MTGPRLVVPTDPATPSSFADKARAILEKALAQNPEAILIVWETQKEFDFAAVPAAQSVAIGLLNMADAVVNPAPVFE